MRAGANKVIIRPDEPKRELKLPNGKKIFFPISFNEPARHRIISGEVIATPFKLEGPISHYDQIIREGDRIVFHYNCITDDPELDKGYIEGGLNAIPYSLIFYTVRNDEIHPVGDYIIVEPEYESLDDVITQSGIFLKPEPENKPMMGRIKYSGNYKPQTGDDSGHENLTPGTRVIFNKYADIPIQIDGVLHYRQRFYDILLYEKDGEWHTWWQQTLIRPKSVDRNIGSGLILPDHVRVRKNFRAGTIIKPSPIGLLNGDVKENDIILYEDSGKNEVEIDGEKLIVQRNDNIAMVLPEEIPEVAW